MSAETGPAAAGLFGMCAMRAETGPAAAGCSEWARRERPAGRPVPEPGFPAVGRRGRMFSHAESGPERPGPEPGL